MLAAIKFTEQDFGLEETSKRRLIERAKEGDISARQELVTLHWNLIVGRAKRLSRAGASLEIGDLIQQGCVGLLRAIEKFDPGRQSNGRCVSFITYATYWIDHSIRRTIQNEGWTIAIPVSVQRDSYAVRCAATHLRISGDPVGNDEVIAQGLGMSQERCEALTKIPQEVVSLDGFPEENAPLHRIRSREDETERLAQENENCRQVRELVAKLSGIERTIIEALYGLREGFEPKSTEEVARLLSVSSRRVRKLREKALQKLKMEIEL